MPTSRSRQAYDELRRMILAGEIDPEDPLTERGLSERIGLGRTPVREALKDLGRDGLVAVFPGRGTFLRTLTLPELRALYEIRMGLEGIAAYLVAQRGAPPALLAFEPIFERHLADADTPLVEIQDAGTRFSSELMAASENARLIAFHNDLSDQIQVTMRLARSFDQSRVRTTIGEHLEILRAIIARDPDRAQHAVYVHLSNAIAVGVQIFSRIKGGATAPAVAL